MGLALIAGYSWRWCFSTGLSLDTSRRLKSSLIIPGHCTPPQAVFAQRMFAKIMFRVV